MKTKMMKSMMLMGMLTMSMVVFGKTDGKQDMKRENRMEMSKDYNRGGKDKMMNDGGKHDKYGCKHKRHHHRKGMEKDMQRGQQRDFKGGDGRGMRK